MRDVEANLLAEYKALGCAKKPLPFRICKFCMERIPFDATVCKFCTREVATEAEADALMLAYVQNAIKEKKDLNRRRRIAVVVIGLLLIAFLIFRH
jgi:hypothetical protein